MTTEIDPKEVEARLAAARVEALEEKVAWLEHQLAELDHVLRAAFARMDALERDLDGVKAERSAPEDGPADPWEPPPHY